MAAGSPRGSGVSDGWVPCPPGRPLCALLCLQQLKARLWSSQRRPPARTVAGQ